MVIAHAKFGISECNQSIPLCSYASGSLSSVVKPQHRDKHKKNTGTHDDWNSKLERREYSSLFRHCGKPIDNRCESGLTVIAMGDLNAKVSSDTILLGYVVLMIVTHRACNKTARWVSTERLRISSSKFRSCPECV